MHREQIFKEGFLAKDHPTDLKNYPQFKEHLQIHDQIPQLTQDGSLRARIKKIPFIEVGQVQFQTENDR